MPKLTVFNNVSLDGYFVDARGDMSWAHQQDPEWRAFAAENAQGGGALVFGRVTYEMMAGFWPTPQATAHSPAVAERMNTCPKIVFSRTLRRASWNNTQLVAGDPAVEMRKIKEAAGPDLAVLGSGSLVAQLAAAGLVDEFQLAVHPVVLGGGRSLFAGLKERLDLRPTRTRTFGNGTILLCYEPKG